MSLRKVFTEYEHWYRTTYLATSEDDGDAPGALDGLATLTKRRLAALEAKEGPLPAAYHELVLEVGVGEVLLATSSEPVAFTVLAPPQIPKARAHLLAGLDAATRRRAQEKEGLDPAKLMPFLVDRDWNMWALLGHQNAKDDRALLFSHEQERRPSQALFAPKGTLETYFAALFAKAKARASPWHLWTGAR